MYDVCRAIGFRMIDSTSLLHEIQSYANGQNNGPLSGLILRSD